MLSVFKTNIKIIFSVGFIVLCLSADGAAQNQAILRGVVNSHRLNIRKAPSLLSDVVIIADQGETVAVLEKQGGIGGWLLVEYKGRKGYVRNRPQYIELMAITQKPKKKESIQADIQAQEKRVETFSQKEIEIMEGLNEIDRALNSARLNAQALSMEIRQMEEKISQLQQDREILSEEITRNLDYAGERMRALYKMNKIGRLDVAGLPSSVFDFFVQQNSMKIIVESDLEVIDRQNTDLEMIEKLEQEVQKEIQARTILEATLNDQIRMSQTETQKKEQILKEIRQKKNLSLAAVESLKLAAIQLDKEIESIRPGEEKKMDGDLFSEYQGRLRVPVKGEIMSTFGPEKAGKYNSFTFQKGIDIKVEKGEPVRSVFRGEVMFAQWLKGYGNLLIINHGDNYYTLYAHVEEMFKKKGDRVETGDVIATTGDTGSIKGMSLYFEIRHHGKPLDPMKWLRKGA